MSVKGIEELKTRSVLEFRRERPEICAHVEKVVEHFEAGNDLHITHAPVKSGKREMVLYHSLLTQKPNQRIYHAFVTALDRRDCQSQLQEFRSYKIPSFVVTKSEQTQELGEWLDTKLGSGQDIVVHLDELDYGTGRNQRLGDALENVLNTRRRSQRGKLYLSLYSATPEEAVLSDWAVDDPCCAITSYLPPITYRGADYYLDNDLVHEAEPFYDKELGELTAQGKKAMEFFLASDKPFAVVRFADGLKRDEEDILEDHIYEEYGIAIRYVDQSRSANWGKGGGLHETAIKLLNKNKKRLIVVYQTCSRSTEVGIHDYIAFWHDYRKNSNYATYIQAVGRVFCYRSDEERLPDIRVYAHKEDFEVHAGQRPYDLYDRKLGGRVIKFRTDRSKAYEVTVLRSVPCQVKPMLASSYDRKSHIRIYRNVEQMLDYQRGDKFIHYGSLHDGAYDHILLDGIHEDAHPIEKRAFDSAIVRFEKLCGHPLMGSTLAFKKIEGEPTPAINHRTKDTSVYGSM